MGATFENLYVHTKRVETVLLTVEEILKKRGYTRIDNEDAAELCFSVHTPETGSWCFVTCDSETPGFMKRLGKSLAGFMETEALYAACEDSDLMKASLLTPTGGCAEIRIDVCKPAAAPKDTVVQTWKRVFSDTDAFINAASAEYTCAEKFLFAIAPHVGLPTEDMIYWEPDAKQTSLLCFAKKQKNAAGKSAAALLGAALKEKGFVKLPHGFYRPLNGEMGLRVTVEREKHASYSVENNGFSYMCGTDKTAYDLRVCVTNEENVRENRLRGTELRLIAGIPQKALIVDLENDARGVTELLLNAFDEYAYTPLFQNDRPTGSVFDTMCLWDLHAYGTVHYHSYFKALAAYRENRTFSALFCLKWIFCQNLREPAEVSDYNVHTLSDEEIDALRQSERYEVLKDCFALYDRLCIHNGFAFEIRPRTLRPQRLRPGDTVGIISPCSLAERDIIEGTAKTLKEMGYRVKFSRNLFANTWGFAGSLEERAADFNAMIADDKVKMVLFGGGEVGNQLLYEINYGLLRARPKILCSFSDSTTILNAVTHMCKLVTFYGASPRTFSDLSTYNRQIFTDRLVEPTLTHTPAGPWKTIIPGVCEGELAGGYLVNYATLYGLDRYPAAPQNCILLIEDHEMFNDPAAVSKYFANLEHRGVFRRAEGLLFGHYSAEPNPLIDAILLRVGQKFNIPVARCDDFGHGENNAIFPLGAKARLDTETRLFQKKFKKKGKIFKKGIAFFKKRVKIYLALRK